jgi:hypothetical protein
VDLKTQPPTLTSADRAECRRMLVACDARFARDGEYLAQLRARWGMSISLEADQVSRTDVPAPSQKTNASAGSALACRRLEWIRTR